MLGYFSFKKGGGRFTLADVLELIPREMPAMQWPPWGSSQGKYGRVPDSALDDELDLGDEEEAEELHDGDMYAYDNPNRSLGTLPVRAPDAPAPKLPAPSGFAPQPAAEGNLLGDLDDGSKKGH